jgi:hypothetical protein
LYFLEDDNRTNEDIKEKYDIKNKSCQNLCNSDKTKENCKMEKNLIDRPA